MIPSTVRSPVTRDCVVMGRMIDSPVGFSGEGVERTMYGVVVERERKGQDGSRFSYVDPLDEEALGEEGTVEDSAR